MRIGVLALQGAFAEHVSTLHAIGVEAVEVRLPEDLARRRRADHPGRREHPPTVASRYHWHPSSAFAPR